MNWLKIVLRINADEAGQDAAEYALLIGLIALAVVVALTAVGINLATAWAAITAAYVAAFP